MKNNLLYFKAGQTIGDAIRAGQFAEDEEQAEIGLGELYDGGYRSYEEYREQGCFVIGVDQLIMGDE